jgi:hypothetical protein
MNSRLPKGSVLAGIQRSSACLGVLQASLTGRLRWLADFNGMESEIVCYASGSTTGRPLPVCNAHQARKLTARAVGWDKRLGPRVRLQIDGNDHLRPLCGSMMPAAHAANA